MNRVMTNQEFFYFFLRYKIDSGVKQIDLVRSDFVNVSPSYLNKLYLNPPKTCAIDIQTSIANYFGLSYDEMITEAKRIYKEENRHTEELQRYKSITKPPEQQTNSERRSYEPNNLVEQLMFITEGIRSNQNETIDLEKERDELLLLLNDLQTGICVADSELNIIYQNPRHRKMFGNRTDKKYGLFWENHLSKEEIFGKLTTGAYEALKVKHMNKNLHIQLTLRYKGNRVDKVIEHVIDLQEKQDDGSIEKLELYTHVFKELDHGFAFFNNNRELELASNKFGLLDDYDFHNVKPSVDQLLLDLGSKMIGGLEKIALMKKAYEKREEINLNLEIDNIPYNFQSRNISENDKHLGILLIVRKRDK